MPTTPLFPPSLWIRLSAVARCSLRWSCRVRPPQNPAVASRWLVGVAVLSSLLLAHTAAATPFTLPERKLAVDLSYGFDEASTFWTVSGERQIFSLGGRFTASSVLAGIRYGIVDMLEGQIRTSYKAATYTASPIHLFPSAAPASAGQLTSGVINFSGQEAGLSDVYVGFSFNPLRRFVNLAIETEAKIPTGYRAPSGTLCSNLDPDTVRSLVRPSILDPSRPQVTPDLFCTGATLGDGQPDLLVALQIGRYIARTRTLLRGDAGMNFRFGGPGQQFIGSLKIGESIGDRLVLYGGARIAYTVNSGSPIGTTVDSALPEAPATAYPGDPVDRSRPQSPDDLDKLLVYNVATRDRSFLFIDVGAILRLTTGLELRANYSRALWGINFPEVNSVQLGIAFLAL